MKKMFAFVLVVGPVLAFGAGQSFAAEERNLKATFKSDKTAGLVGSSESKSIVGPQDMRGGAIAPIDNKAGIVGPLDSHSVIDGIKGEPTDRRLSLEHKNELQSAFGNSDLRPAMALDGASKEPGDRAVDVFIKGEDQIKGETSAVVSPRDAASGLPTGKRMHKPMEVAAVDTFIIGEEGIIGDRVIGEEGIKGESQIKGEASIKGESDQEGILIGLHKGEANSIKGESMIKGESAIKGESNSAAVDRARKRMNDATKDLESQDKMGNFEIQGLMSQYNQAETLSSNVQKKADDTVSGQQNKIG